MLEMFAVAGIEPIKRLEFELRAARDEAQKLATHDFLTGLPNRLLLHDRAIEAIARAKRTGVSGSHLLTIDVDNFKLVNDSYGHPAGDQLLIDIAGRIKSCVRDYDTVARIGGDEFVVLTTGGPLQEGIEALAARMLESARQPAQIGGGIDTQYQRWRCWFLGTDRHWMH
ncbi:GGDEF domain-containing protein [Paucibacter sp. O1-1]|nr:GGDEF domain-containing protein [Paucibacter sp. O1-1]MDA3830908.1 GGDEF domain-containing protein [Paucibacter sp. O1-1]